MVEFMVYFGIKSVMHRLHNGDMKFSLKLSVGGYLISLNEVL